MNELRKLVLGMLAVAALVSFSVVARAQQQPQPLKVTKVKDNVYWVQGGDADPHVFPHCSLLDAQGNPKPALDRLRTLRHLHLK